MRYGQVLVLTLDGGQAHAQPGALLRWVGKQFSSTLYPDDKLMEIEEAIGVVEGMRDSFLLCM
jgi:hypothetical protein